MHTLQKKARSVSAGIPSAARKRGTATAGISSSPIKALSVSAGIPSAPRSAFTLVELLVVIAILAMLASLITMAASRAMTAARNAAIKAEIDMLHMAIMNYKIEYGSFPPCADTTTAYASNGPASKHLARLFPRCANPTGTGANAQFAGALPLTPATALIAWLTGYTSDSSLPLTGGTRTKLYDYDKSRLDTNQLVYFPSGKKGSPYIYINNEHYKQFDKIGGATSMGWPITSPATPFSFVVGSDTVTIQTGTYYPTHIPTSAAAADWTNVTQPYFNPDSFQILCAGRDEIFGNDDDLSNFWPGTRKDYLDSLNQ